MTVPVFVLHRPRAPSFLVDSCAEMEPERKDEEKWFLSADRRCALPTVTRAGAGRGELTVPRPEAGKCRASTRFAGG
jgi:hypothetical protein